MPKAIKTMREAAEVSEDQNSEIPEEEKTEVATEEVIDVEVPETKVEETPTEVTPEEVTPKKVEIDPIAELEKLKVDSKVLELVKSGFLRTADYTRKTQEIAGQRKDLEEYTKLKPFIDKVFQDKELYAKVFGVNPETDGEITEEYPEDPVEYARFVKDKTKAETKAEIRAEMAQDADYQEAERVDPRLNTDSIFAKQVAGYVAQDREFTGYYDERGQFVTPTKTATQATRDAIEAHDKDQSAFLAKYREELVAKAKAKKMVIPSTGSPASTAGKQPQTMAEAAMQAEEEMAHQ